MSIKILISESILKEGKEDFLKNQYITTGKQVDKSVFNEIDEETFNKIYQADPFNGKYAAWLLNLYKYKQLKLEDLYKAEEYLTLFDKIKNKLPNKDLLARNGKEYVYSSLASLYKAIQPFEEYKSNSELKREVKKNESKRIYEDSEFLIIAPLTENAACYYGANTEWCTAANKNNMFDHYNEQGQLYIIIDKKEKRKYQFHQEAKQLMDELDSPVSWDEIVENLSQLTSIFRKIIKGRYELGYFDTYGLFDSSIQDWVVGEEWNIVYDYIVQYPYYQNETFIVYLNGKYGVATKNNEKILDIEYDKIEYGGRNYVVTLNNKKGIFDSKGNLIVKFEYDYLGYDKQKDVFHGIKNKHSYSIDKYGNEKLEM